MMFRHRNHTHIAVTLAVVTIGIGCSSSESPKNQVKRPKKVVASSATWLATLDHGDKPGNGYELIVRDGRVTGGVFHLLDPNKPHDLESAGQTVAFDRVKHSGERVTFSFTLRDGEGKLHSSLTMTLLDELAGDVGEKIRAKVQENAPRRAVQDLTFVRSK